MLVLSRKIGEKVILGNGVTVVVLGRRGDQIKLGFEAPPEVKIQREEIRGVMRESESAAVPV